MDMDNSEAFIELAAEIVSAYVSNNSVPASELPGLINDVHSAIVRVKSGPARSSNLSSATCAPNTA